ncbi:putative hexosyltransferase [Vibrio sp. AND4]|nr:putative hexosyltransferase [Vibrio sp. AND4]
MIGEVWILLDSGIFGGIESHVIELSRGLMVSNVHVRVVLVSEHSPPTPLFGKLKHENIPVSYLWHLCPKSERSNAISVKQITSAVAEYQPNVIHTHGYKAGVLARSARLFTRTFPRLISTYHAGETPKGKVWFYDWIDRHSGHLSDHCFSVSQTIQRKVLTQSELLNNFVSVPKPKQDCPYKEIAFVGRLSYEKGADQFMEIARHIPDSSFSIYGDGPEKSSLSTNAPPNVFFHGYQNDMNVVWSNISVLIISSRYEGLPMVALEAMARGIVVISLNVGRLPDLIENGKNGFIANDLPALINRVDLWLTMSHSEQYSLRLQAIETIKNHYSTSCIIPILIERYQIEITA